MPQQLANRAQTTLNGAILVGATSITVTSATGFPSSAPYRIIVLDAAGNVEFMEVTAGAGTTTWTVTRQVEDSSRFPAFAFGSGATVAQVLSAGALNAFFDATAGHAHDGTAGNGPKLALSSLKGSRCYASASGTQSLSNATATALALDTTDLDTDPSGNAQHSNVTNNSRLTCKTAGDYIIGGGFVFASNATGFRWAYLFKNATTYLDNIGFQAPTGTGVSALVSLTTFASLAVNDYVELFGYQDSGGSLATSTAIGKTHLWWVRVA